jgi:hypothetical protein
MNYRLTDVINTIINFVQNSIMSQLIEHLDNFSERSIPSKLIGNRNQVGQQIGYQMDEVLTLAADGEQKT